MHSQTIHVPDRLAHCHGETGLARSPSHEAHTVAPEATLACSREFGKDHSIAPLSTPRSRLMVGREQCSSRPKVASPSTCSANVYRRLKRRLGRTLRGLYCKRDLVKHRKSPPHQLSGIKGSLPGPQEFRASLQGPDCLDSNRQHNCGLLHQQGGRYEIRFSLCPPLETFVLVSPQRHCTEGSTHSRSLECHSRQAVTTQPSDRDRVVPISAGIQSFVLHMGPTAGGHICSPVQSQAPQVCVTGTGSESLGSRRPEPTMGESGGLCLSTSLPSQSSDLQGDRSRLSQNDPDCARVAKHALVLGSSQPIGAHPLQASPAKRSGDTAAQRASSQEPQQSESACLAPRASAIQEHWFSNEVAARIEAPQRLSTRAIYKSKWAIFIKWCESNEVDFRSPSLKQIAEFLFHLFKERKLQPSTIEGHRTAIVDTVGNDRLNISKDKNLTRLLDSVHRDKPKGRRGVPTWNLSLVLHQPTKAPFEPMRKASLKHLTFKTVFLLALGSGKRRSEIHAWLYKNIRHQENWSQVSLYPSPSFLSKNQLGREGPTCVAPVVIPALAPSLDKSLAEDKSLPRKSLALLFGQNQGSSQR